MGANEAEPACEVKVNAEPKALEVTRGEGQCPGTNERRGVRDRLSLGIKGPEVGRVKAPGGVEFPLLAL